MGRQFLLEDTGGKDRILVFATEENIQLLAKMEWVFADGTFKASPKIFGQIYIIMGCLKKNAEYKEYIPLVFGLLPNKQKKSYVRFLEILKKHAPQPMQIKTASMDFEVGEINAWKEVFPSISIHLCNFHFNQNIFKPIVRVGLKTAYQKKVQHRGVQREGKLKRYVQAIYGLSFVPLDKIQEAWATILDEAPDLGVKDGKKLEEFLNYITSTYMSNANYPLEMWNNWAKFEHRTNNPNEGFNSSLKA